MAAYPPEYPYPNLQDWRGNRLHPGMHCIPQHFERIRPLAQLFRVELGYGDDTRLVLVPVLSKPGQVQGEPLYVHLAEQLHVVHLSPWCSYKKFMPWYEAFAAAGVLLWVTFDAKDNDPRRAVLHGYWVEGPPHLQGLDFSVNFADAGLFRNPELDCLAYLREQFVRSGCPIQEVESLASSTLR